MHLRNLSLANFRNYAHLELDLPSRILLLQGGNAQGKTNLLEAIYYLATAASPRAERDLELLNWEALKDDCPFARLRGQVGDDRLLEIAIVAPKQASGRIHKEVRINGLARKVSDLVGLLKVVIFLPQDVDLVAGPPNLRRHYLDVAISQLDRRYFLALQDYERVLLQRNHLLRRLREGGDRHQLEFWDQHLVENGARILAGRLKIVQILDDLAHKVHLLLTGGAESLRLLYKSSLSLEETPGACQLPLQGEAKQQPDTTKIASIFRENLASLLRQELQRGMTLVGPHRDDLRFLADGVDLNIYGSRGQQRTSALSLKLAQVELVRSSAGEEPLLLLDDVISELDQERREYLLASLDGFEQVIITTTDLDSFPKDFLKKCALLRIVDGRVEPWAKTHQSGDQPAPTF